jgi:uncharacterized glyoxalase superfamily protein PhnB
MAEAKSARVTIMPTMRYRDAPAAIEWLERAFGFRRHMVVPGPDNTVAHAELSLENGMVMVGSAREDGFPVKPPSPGGALTQSVYLVVADVDVHYAGAKAAGAKILRELQDTEYGSREYSAFDPEGQLWNFGTYDPFAAGKPGEA